MPEIPDVEVYCVAIRKRMGGQVLRRVRVASPFLLRTVDPPVSAAEGRVVSGVTRLGKRIVLHLEGGFALVIHLMIAGRLHWKPPGTKPAGRNGLATFETDAGTLLLTEASTKRRASLHVVRGEDALRALDPGGLEVSGCTCAEFVARLRAGNR